MKIKKTHKNCYEIENNNNLIYISKEQNPKTKVYLYFTDVFDLSSLTPLNSEPCDSEVFDEPWEALEYLENNFNIPEETTKQIKL